MRLMTLKRQLRGWSRAELARRAGLHGPQVCQIESGRLLPYPCQLQRIADALGSPQDADRLLEEAPEHLLTFS